MLDSKVELPKGLISAEYHLKRKLFDNRKALILFDDDFNQTLSIYRNFKLGCRKNFFSMEAPRSLEKRKENIGWYIRQYFKRKDNLEGSFSEELIRLKINDLKNNSYEVHCEQTFANTGASGINPTDAYFLMTNNQSEIKNVLYFCAEEILRRVSKEDKSNFGKQETSKLANFFYEDFTTGKHSLDSQKVGQEADFIFFP
ncbi:MAG: hypothetical protein AABW67_02065 [Nanoarchaeota archaeon]